MERPSLWYEPWPVVNWIQGHASFYIQSVLAKLGRDGSLTH